ncbi:MAG: hypothetical protein HYW52_00580 [Gemmatimonadetes bacterium]|nr:hypothetical protein [Gemmatimonadota bacterium]
MKPALHRTLTTVEYFTFGFGTMVGVGWLVIMDDWLGRGGPGGAALGFLIGGVLLLPIAATYGRLVRDNWGKLNIQTNSSARQISF